MERLNTVNYYTLNTNKAKVIELLDKMFDIDKIFYLAQRPDNLQAVKTLVKSYQETYPKNTEDCKSIEDFLNQKIRPQDCGNAIEVKTKELQGKIEDSKGKMALKQGAKTARTIQLFENQIKADFSRYEHLWKIQDALTADLQELVPLLNTMVGSCNAVDMQLEKSFDVIRDKITTWGMALKDVTTDQYELSQDKNIPNNIKRLYFNEILRNIISKENLEHYDRGVINRAFYVLQNLPDQAPFQEEQMKTLYTLIAPIIVANYKVDLIEMRMAQLQTSDRLTQDNTCNDPVKLFLSWHNLKGFLQEQNQDTSVIDVCQNIYYENEFGDMFAEALGGTKIHPLKVQNTEVLTQESVNKIIPNPITQLPNEESKEEIPVNKKKNKKKKKKKNLVQDQTTPQLHEESFEAQNELNQDIPKEEDEIPLNKNKQNKKNKNIHENQTGDIYSALNTQNLDQLYKGSFEAQTKLSQDTQEEEVIALTPMEILKIELSKALQQEGADNKKIFEEFKGRFISAKKQEDAVPDMIKKDAVKIKVVNPFQGISDERVIQLFQHPIKQGHSSGWKYLRSKKLNPIQDCLRLNGQEQRYAKDDTHNNLRLTGIVSFENPTNIHSDIVMIEVIALMNKKEEISDKKSEEAILNYSKKLIGAKHTSQSTSQGSTRNSTRKR
jgi:hypothetical protein